MVEYKVFTRFILRTPLCSFRELHDFLGKETYDESAGFMFDFFSRPLHQEALFLASPVLYEKMLSARANTEDAETVVLSLAKYFLRMTTRATPFGLFAGCNVGSFADKTSIQIQSASKNLAHTRLDMNYLCTLAERLACIPEIRDQLLFYPNTSIYAAGHQVRYVEYHYNDKLQRIHRLSAVDNSVYLQQVLTAAKHGANVASLIQCLTRDGEIDPEEASGFVEEIISSQLLVSELEPAVSGSGFLTQIISVLRTKDLQIPVTINGKSLQLNNLVSILADIDKLLQDINKETSGVSAYEELIRKIETLGVTIDAGKLFQTDLIREYRQCHLQSSVADDIVEGLKILDRLTFPEERTAIRAFAEAFTERYGEREVPLLQALDVETGIGFLKRNVTSEIPKFLKDLRMTGAPADSFQLTWHNSKAFLIRKYMDCLRNGLDTMTITEDELSSLKPEKTDLFDTMSSMVSVIQEDGIEKIVIPGASGNAAKVLGRFCYADQEIFSHVSDIVSKEEELGERDVIFADIIHLPETRLGNIALKPVLRKYEIPYLAKSGAMSENQILPEDLMISVRGHRVRLRSKRLNKFVIPCLTNAHNFHVNSLPVYHFLCSMNAQEKRESLFFPWGGLESVWKFTPRVCYKNIILSLATWILDRSDYDSLLKASEAELAGMVADLRKKLKIPQRVVLVEGDNELFIDLSNTLCVGIFLNTIKSRAQVKLVEYILNDENAVVRDERGHGYAAQFIVSLFRADEKAVRSQTVPEAAQSSLQRDFSVGSEWLYYKLYAGEQVADELLKTMVKPLTEHLLKNGLIDHWFFIRYADPEHHLRIRFHLRDVSRTGEIIQLVNHYGKTYIDNGLIWKVQAETYSREIERYGIDTMTHSECLFWHDSEMVLQMLQFEEDHPDDDLRWIFAVRVIDQTLQDFQLSDSEKLALMKELADNYGSEFSKDKFLRKQLADKFRRHREVLASVLEGKHEAFGFLFSPIEERSVRTNGLCAAIRTLVTGNQTSLTLNSLIASYLHMFMNRTFRSMQRMHEMVIYDFVWCMYKSNASRKRKSGNAVNDATVLQNDVSENVSR